MHCTSTKHEPTAFHITFSSCRPSADPLKGALETRSLALDDVRLKDMEARPLRLLAAFSCGFETPRHRMKPCHVKGESHVLSARVPLSQFLPSGLAGSNLSEAALKLIYFMCGACR